MAVEQATTYLKNWRILPKDAVKHGETTGRIRSPEYRAWARMIQRCEDRNDIKFHRYGGRGICVCERWRLSFGNFLDDMGRKPSNAHSLDRIDSEKGYSPENCRWATRLQQQRNRTNNRMIEFNGKSQCISAWSEETGLKWTTIGSRLDKGWSISDALTLPLKAKRQ